MQVDPWHPAHIIRQFTFESQVTLATQLCSTTLPLQTGCSTVTLRQTMGEPLITESKQSKIRQKYIKN